MAGLTLYAMWKEALYGEVGLHRSAKQGAANPVTGAAGPLDGATDNVIKGSAPYFRVAYEQQWGRHSLEAGMCNADFKLLPGGSADAPGLPAGPSNEFRDLARDFQYQFIADQHIFTLSGTRIHESMELDASYSAESPAADVDAPANARRVAITVCSTCHGVQGRNAQSKFPQLAGQRANYLAAQPKTFRAQTRGDPDALAYMWGMSATLDDEMIDALAAYYSGQHGPGGRAKARAAQVAWLGIPADAFAGDSGYKPERPQRAPGVEEETSMTGSADSGGAVASFPRATVATTPPAAAAGMCPPPPPPAVRGLPDPPTSTDRLLHASLGHFTLGLAPTALWLAYADWALHLALSPGKQQQLVEKGVRKSIRLLTGLPRLQAGADGTPCIEPLPQDRRFSSAAWQPPPFNLIWQAFLLNQQWWHSATTGVGGVSPHHEQVVAFMTRQLLDLVSPVNFIATNPEVLRATLAEGGLNLVRGGVNFWQDWERALGGKPPIGAEAFEPGRQVAATPGKVVYRNRLIELIQYAPATPVVRAEPILIVPAWIMKYYILDLSPANSLVKYLVDHGHTVFMISWHNPGAEDRDLGMNDYLRLGVLEALEAVRAIVPGQRVDAVGYCIGGTLLAIAAAYLARERRELLGSVTLFAAQTDFTEAGEPMLFIDDSQLDFLEDMMWDQGYLDTRQMAGAFQLLRSNDLVWSRMVREYLMGRRQPLTDLMAWNADTTRMPYRMHSEYLRSLFLDNDLFEGRYAVDGRAIALGDIRVPLFVVATETDHVAPWRSVYKLNLASDTDLTFVLTSGGHNAGIISEPGHPDRHYRVAMRPAGAPYVDPETWCATARYGTGSWWEVWLAWLRRDTGPAVPPPALGAAVRGYPVLGDAPGRYVHEH